MLPKMVDELICGEHIYKLFATKYDDLYNSVAYNDDDMASLLPNIHSNVDAQCNDCENSVTIDNVLMVSTKLKVTHMMDTGWYIPIILFMLLTNYMFFYLCYSHQWCTMSSTAKCTFAVMETVNYFQQNKFDVYVLLLDATK